MGQQGQYGEGCRTLEPGGGLGSRVRDPDRELGAEAAGDVAAGLIGSDFPFARCPRCRSRCIDTTSSAHHGTHMSTAAAISAVGMWT